jgi:hypothetical protein
MKGLDISGSKGMHLIADFFEQMNATQNDLIYIYRPKTDFCFALCVKSLKG